MEVYPSQSLHDVIHKSHPVLTAWGFLTVGCLAVQAQEIHRDYPFEQPIPATGRVTQRLPLAQVPAHKLFAPCPKATRPVEYAESTNFQVMICADAQATRNFKYWIQKSKKTQKLTQIVARQDPNSPQTLWQSGDYQVMIYADGARPNTINAYLESYNRKTQKGIGEALLYHYSLFYSNR